MRIGTACFCLQRVLFPARAWQEDDFQVVAISTQVIDSTIGSTPDNPDRMDKLNVFRHVRPSKDSVGTTTSIIRRSAMKKRCETRLRRSTQLTASCSGAAIHQQNALFPRHSSQHRHQLQQHDMGENVASASLITLM